MNGQPFSSKVILEITFSRARLKLTAEFRKPSGRFYLSSCAGVAELSYESARNRHFLKFQIMN
jgi:hypothetical protein